MVPTTIVFQPGTVASVNEVIANQIAPVAQRRDGQQQAHEAGDPQRPGGEGCQTVE